MRPATRVAIVASEWVGFVDARTKETVWSGPGGDVDLRSIEMMAAAHLTVVANREPHPETVGFAVTRAAAHGMCRVGAIVTIGYWTDSGPSPFSGP